MSGLSESHVHVFVADVVKSFDTVDRVWFRRVYFGYHANVRLRFKLACFLVHLGLGMEAFLKVARLARFLSLLFTFLGVESWSLSLVLCLSFMLII